MVTLAFVFLVGVLVGYVIKEIVLPGPPKGNINYDD